MRQKWIGCLVAAAVWMISSGLVDYKYFCSIHPKMTAQIVVK